MKKILSHSVFGFLLLILSGGVLFLWLLINEYNDQQNLIDDNQRLTHSIIERNWMSQLERLISHAPQNVSDVIAFSLKSDQRYYWFENHELVVPKRPRKTLSQWHELWRETLESINSEELKENIHSDVFTVRLDRIIEVKKAIKTQSNDQLKISLSRYLGHLESYRLTPHQEIASRLALFQINDNNNWSQELHQSMVYNGFDSESTHIDSILQICATYADQWTFDELQWIAERVIQQSERVNVFDPRFNHLLDWLEKANQLPVELEMRSEVGSNRPSVSSQGLIAPALNGGSLLIQIDVLEQVNLIHQQLIEQGLLTPSDEISIALTNTFVPDNDIRFTLQQPHVVAQRKQHRVYFALKILGLMLLIGLSVLSLFSLRNWQKQKEKAIEIKENFISLVSHELKTPLASIRLMAEILQKRLQNQLPPKDYPNRILNESDRLWLMVENLLSFNRIQSNMIALAKEKVDFSDLIDEINAVESAEDIAIINKIERFEQIADRTLVELVIRNIVSNAIKYCGEKPASVWISQRANSQTLEIIDNGKGIAKKDWNKVFDFYYRGESRTQSGFGLGLALCRKIMQLHGGDLYIHRSICQDENPSHSGTVWHLKFSTH